MNLPKLNQQAARSINHGRMDAVRVSELCREHACEISDVMLSLLPEAKRLAHPPISSFSVGCVLQCSSGNLYLGANLEWPAGPLSLSVHAEQAAVLHALCHGETGAKRLAISAAPCGMCRQFLYELAESDKLEIYLSDGSIRMLKDLLPDAFGPGYLGIQSSLLQHSKASLDLGEPTPSKGALAALQTAECSYAPYTQAYAGASLVTRDGDIVSGMYIENAAFNPSLSPLQTAIVHSLLQGISLHQVRKMHMVQREDSQIDHFSSAQWLIQRYFPDVEMEFVEATLKTTTADPFT